MKIHEVIDNHEWKSINLSVLINANPSIEHYVLNCFALKSMIGKKQYTILNYLQLLTEAENVAAYQGTETSVFIVNSWRQYNSVFKLYFKLIEGLSQ